MNKRIASILKYLFFLGIGVSLAWWQFSKMTPIQKHDFYVSLLHANYWLLIPVFLMAVLSHISRAIRWKILIEPMGYHPSTLTTFYSVMSGYLVNTFIPRAGEIFKCSLLKKYEGIPMNKLIGTVLVERVFDLSCYFVLIVITILLQIKFVSTFIKDRIDIALQKAHNAFLIKAVILIVGVLLLILLIKWLFKRFADHKIVVGLKGFHLGLSEGFKTIKYLKKKRLFIFHTILIWLLYIMQIYVGFFALTETSGLHFIHACSVLSLATLGMIVSPGGIGAFPLAVQQVLLIYGIDNVSYGWLIWGVSTAIIIIIGLLCLSLILYTTKPKYETSGAAIR
jgi:glycosyltransferase 2 family protein